MSPLSSCASGRVWSLICSPISLRFRPMLVSVNLFASKSGIDQSKSGIDLFEADDPNHSPAYLKLMDEIKNKQFKVDDPYNSPAFLQFMDEMKNMQNFFLTQMEQEFEKFDEAIEKRRINMVSDIKELESVIISTFQSICAEVIDMFDKELPPLKQQIRETHMEIRKYFLVGGFLGSIGLSTLIILLSRSKMGRFQNLRNFDAFPRTEEHLLQKTHSGAIVSIIGIAVMVTLFVHEL